MSSFSHYRVLNHQQVPDLAGSEEQTLGNFIANLNENMKIKIIKSNDEEIVFDLTGVDASIANALRRILLSEVPTVAIETVYIETNTSIIQDEVLSHRLGLVPIKVDPNCFEDYSEEDGPTDLNTIVFKLDANCIDPRSPAEQRKDSEPYTHEVLSGEFEWVPQGSQAEKFPGLNFIWLTCYLHEF